jgi:hypothetical protein
MLAEAVLRVVAVAVRRTSAFDRAGPSRAESGQLRLAGENRLIEREFGLDRAARFSSRLRGCPLMLKRRTT